MAAVDSRSCETMKLSDVIRELNLTPISVADDGNIDVTSAYCGDLLSDVLAHAKPNSLWFTIQSHLNTIAVAQLRDIACIVLVNGVAPDPQTIAKAKSQEISLCGSEETSAALCMRLTGLF
jgi:hypothetical protein